MTNILLITGFVVAMIGLFVALTSLLCECFDWFKTDIPMILSAVMTYGGVFMMLIGIFSAIILGGH